MDKGKWSLHIGCHRGTLMSRDSTVNNHASLDACREDVREADEAWRRRGCFVWFANAIGPDGEVIKLHPGTPYER